MKKGLMYFVIGAVVGAVPAWYFTKKAYERIANEAIQDVKDMYQRRREQDILAEKARTKPPLEEMAQKIRDEVEKEDEDYEIAQSILEDCGYTTNGEFKGFERPSVEERLASVPYVISPEMFGEAYGAGNIYTMTYYAKNGVLVDDTSGMVEDIETTVGYDALRRFGEYEKNIIHVRNDRYLKDIEVCYDPNAYDGVEGTPLYNPEDDFDDEDE